MMKILAIAVSGVLVGFAGMALADDMSHMDMGHMGGTPAKQIAATAPNAVGIDNFAFTPQSITVAVGTTLTWTNHDDEGHTVVSDDPLFKSAGLDTDDTFTFTFAKAGTYKYHCSIHPRMTGTIVVQ